MLEMGTRSCLATSISHLRSREGVTSSTDIASSRKSCPTICADGRHVGDDVGFELGTAEGTTLDGYAVVGTKLEGTCVGYGVGWGVGISVGSDEGCSDGAMDGDVVVGKPVGPRVVGDIVHGCRLHQRELTRSGHGFAIPRDATTVTRTR